MSKSKRASLLTRRETGDWEEYQRVHEGAGGMEWSSENANSAVSPDPCGGYSKLCFVIILYGIGLGFDQFSV